MSTFYFYHKSTSTGLWQLPLAPNHFSDWAASPEWMDLLHSSRHWSGGIRRWHVQPQSAHLVTILPKKWFMKSCILWCTIFFNHFIQRFYKFSKKLSQIWSTLLTIWIWKKIWPPPKNHPVSDSHGLDLQGVQGIILKAWTKSVTCRVLWSCCVTCKRRLNKKATENNFQAKQEHLK